MNNDILIIERLASLPKKEAYIVDHAIFNLYPELFLNVDPSRVKIIVNPEASKNWNETYQILHFFNHLNLSRPSEVMVIGGGALSDLAGFAASIYKRGIKYSIVPTTLLSMVDAGIGGKTAINFEGIKNLIGTFWKPNEVICSLHFLGSLDPVQILSGKGEILKYAMIRDMSLLEVEGPKPDYKRIISKCLLIKKEITDLDPRDESTRHVLNFGHTLGHAYEAANHLQIPHGICIIFGMWVEASLSFNEHLIEKDEFEIMESYFKKYKSYFKFTPFDQLIPYLLKDKKNESEIKVHRISKIGSFPFLKSTSIADIKKAYESIWTS